MFFSPQFQQIECVPDFPLDFIVVLRLGLEPRLDVYKTSSLTISRPQGLVYKTEQIPKQFIKSV